MNQKKILIVCRYFYPDISPRSFRATELAKEFARQGHEVVVLTPKKFEHFDFEKKHRIQIKDLGTLKWKLPNFGKSKIACLASRAVRRLLLLMFEYPDIEMMGKVSNALKHEKGHEILISIAVPYPIHWGVAWRWSKNQQIAKIWVADCGDPYMFSAFDSFSKLFYFKYLEKWFSRKADYITIPRIEMINNFYEEFHGKIRAITQGFRFDDIKVFEDNISNPVPTFAFAGNFIKTTRNPEALLDYLSNLNMDFKFIIYTKMPQLGTPFKERMGNRLEIHDFIPRKELLYKLSKMDFLINIAYNPANQVPSKLIDYYLTTRPVLSLPSNEVDEPIIKQFLNGDYTNQFRLDNPEQFRIENVAKKFLDLLDQK